MLTKVELLTLRWESCSLKKDGATMYHCYIRLRRVIEIFAGVFNGNRRYISGYTQRKAPLGFQVFI